MLPFLGDIWIFLLSDNCGRLCGHEYWTFFETEANLRMAIVCNLSYHMLSPLMIMFVTLKIQEIAWKEVTFIPASTGSALSDVEVRSVFKRTFRNSLSLCSMNVQRLLLLLANVTCSEIVVKPFSTWNTFFWNICYQSKGYW